MIETGHPDTYPGVMHNEGAVQGGCQGLARIGPGKFTGMWRRLLIRILKWTGQCIRYFYSSGSTGK